MLTTSAIGNCEDGGYVKCVMGEEVPSGTTSRLSPG